MTIFGPDVSGFENGRRLTAGTPYVAAKATQGTGYVDGSYPSFEAQAGAIGALFSAYHFLQAGNPAGQASHAHAIVGGTPLFLDFEPYPAVGSYPTLADAAGFVDAYRALGGRVWAVYLPRWYWSDPARLNSASLAPLMVRGLALISSNYPPEGYSDTGPGWEAYGGMAPSLWQYTDRQSYNGYNVDFNAFRGTRDELAALITGGADMLTSADAKVIYEYGEESVTLPDGRVVGASLGNLAHGAWVAVNDAKTGNAALSVKLDAIAAAVSKLTAPVPAVVDLPALEALIEQHLAAGSVPGVIAAAVAHHLGADLTAGG